MYVYFACICTCFRICFRFRMLSSVVVSSSRYVIQTSTHNSSRTNLHFSGHANIRQTIPSTLICFSFVRPPAPRWLLYFTAWSEGSNKERKNKW